MFQTLKNAFLSPDIRKKMFLTLILILIYRIGCFVPIPGLDYSALGTNALTTSDFALMMSAITGNSFQNMTLFALGILPYINSFIIMQLLTLIIPKLEKLSKEGEEGRKKINAYTRYVSIILAIIQAIGIMFAWEGYIEPIFKTEGDAGKIITMIFIIIILTGGSSLVMWIGERITEFGVGNGSSMIIFIGILSSFGNSLLQAFINIKNKAATDDYTPVWFLMGFFILVVALFFLIIFVDMADRKISVQYAKQIKGNKMYGGQSTHIPIKVNASGVMPIIFASSLILFPQMIFQFANIQASAFGLWWTKWLGVNGNLYAPIMFLLIIFFAFFYAQIQFNPDDVAKMLQENGGFIPGIRPGKSTSDHLRKINNRLTLFGALFLGIVA
jgi:preprotein translocase, SecY subunit